MNFRALIAPTRLNWVSFTIVNALSLLKTLATGFIPLLAYILADLVFGETIGLFVGLGIGILEFAISFAREKKADLFIAADTLLLAAMGALSLGLRNQLFFRLKPAVMEGIVAVSMAILLFLPPEALKAYLGHQVRGLELGEGSLPALKRSLRLMVSVLFLHAALTAWAALAASTAVWGFVSGGLLYLMLGGAFAWQWVAARRRRPRAGGGAPHGTPLAASGAAPSTAAPLSWSLLLFDEHGLLYAARDPSGEPALWDSPLRGYAPAAALEASIGQALAAIGFAAPQPATTIESPAAPESPAASKAAAAPSSRIAIQPGFVLDPRGRMKFLPDPRRYQTLADFSAAMEPGDLLVLLGGAPLSHFPKGVDPTSRRLWLPHDLAALAAQGKAAPLLARELDLLASLRDSLRAAAAESIVSATNDAIL
jgi:intracellular septation protein A